MAVTREQVVRTAIALLDEVGLAGLTLRRLAAELGVQAPALYWHVRNKRELLDLMAEEIIAEAVPESLRQPAPGQPWWDWLAARTRASWQALRAHPDGALVVAGNRPTWTALPHIELLLATLVGEGFPPGEALHAILALGTLAAGYALEEQAEANRPAASVAGDQVMFGEVVSAGRFATLAAAISDGAGADSTQAFEYGLQVLVDGLRVRHAALVGRADRAGTGDPADPAKPAGSIEPAPGIGATGSTRAAEASLRAFEAAFDEAVADLRDELLRRPAGQPPGPDA